MTVQTSLPSKIFQPSAERATAAMIASMRHVPASFKAICFACLNIREGLFEMRLPDGRGLLFGGHMPGIDAHIQVRDFAFARRVLAAGDIGFAEGYMEGEWETRDLAALLGLMSLNLERTVKLLKGNVFVQLMNQMRHFGRENTREGARKNILAHYDLGNRFYEAWLDHTMTYSSAFYGGADQPLEDAQINKYRAIANAIDLKPGERVLEIGCGWGGFAEVAAKEYGAHVTGLTLSNEQHDFASARMQKNGLNEAVDITIKDYRDVQGPFDKVVSIEMFEAVGEKYWPTYFSKIMDVLKPGGRAGLQIITIRDDLFDAYRSRADFIQHYIFPGGMLPSEQRLKAEVKDARLTWDGLNSFGQCYARTLAEWNERFRSSWEQIQPLGFDERFKRLWHFYLSYCEAGFRTERTDVVQLALAKR